jgi:hypothetical protein
MASMERDTLIQHLEVTIIYEESSTNTNGDLGRVSNNERRLKKRRKTSSYRSKPKEEC